jgi:hypothetical protein
MTWQEVFEVSRRKLRGDGTRERKKGRTIRRNYEFMFVISFWQRDLKETTGAH